MGAYQLTNLAYLAIKAEAVAGTYLAPVDADFNVRVENLEATLNFNVDDENQKYASGDHAEQESIIGQNWGVITGTIKLCANSGGSVATSPDWWKFAECCGLTKIGWNSGTEVVYGSAVEGVSLVSRKVNDSTTYSAVLVHQTRGATPIYTLYKFAGCMGNMTIGAESVGGPLLGKFTITGKIEDIVDGSTLDMTGPDTLLAEKFINSSVTLYGGQAANAKVSAWEFDPGLEISGITDQGDASGFAYYGVTARRPRLSINPLAVKQATEDVHSIMTAQTSGEISIAVPASSTKLTLKLLDCQMLSTALGDRDGLVSWDRVYKALKNGTTGALTDAALDPEDTFDFLQGART